MPCFEFFSDHFRLFQRCQAFETYNIACEKLKVIMPGHDKARECCRVMIRFSEADVIQPEHDVMVSRDLITRYSEYFRAALEHDCFVEAQTGVLVLDEVDRLPCTRFIWWLYREAGFRNMGELDVDGQMAHEDFKAAHSARYRLKLANRRFYALIQSLIFAEIRQAPEFHNWIMGKLIDEIESKNVVALAQNRFEHVYNNTIRGSLVRKILVDMFLSGLNGKASAIYQRVLIEGDRFYEPHDPTFLEDVLLASLNPNQESLCPTVWDREPYMVEVENVRGHRLLPPTV